MKTIYTQECKETPEGATHYKNVGLATFFYKADGFPVFKWVNGEWIEFSDPDLKINSLHAVLKAPAAKKLFEFLGAPEYMPRYSITAKILGVDRLILPAYKDVDGRPVWITPEHEAVRNELKAERIANTTIQIIKDNYARIAGVKPKPKKRVTVTREKVDYSYGMMMVNAG